MIHQVQHYWRMGSRPGSIPILMLNQLGFNLGFYMLLPYLSGYLQLTLGFSTWMIGLVLGIRNFSQQGFYLFGGTLSDRIGYKPVIVSGCFIRAIGFLSFGYLNNLSGVIIASFLSGFAASLYTPAMQAYLAHGGTKDRAQLFALFNVLAQVGLFLGPLIGVLLLNWNFQWICIISASIFFLLGLLQIYFLPKLDGVESQSKDNFWFDWKNIIKNRNFLWFSLGAMGYYILVMQVYLCLPLEIQRKFGDQKDIGYIFLLSALLSIAFQMKLQKWSQHYLKIGNSIALGIFLMGVSFLPLLFSEYYPSFSSPIFDGISVNPYLKEILMILDAFIIKCLNLGLVLFSITILTLGTLLALPFMMATIPIYSRERRLGAYYGFFYLMAGIGGTLGNVLSGYIYDYSQSFTSSYLIWLFLFFTGLLSAGVFVLLGFQKKIPKMDG